METEDEAYNKWYFGAKIKLPNGSIFPIGTAQLYADDDSLKLDILEQAFKAGWDAHSKSCEKEN